MKQRRPLTTYIDEDQFERFRRLGEDRGYTVAAYLRWLVVRELAASDAAPRLMAAMAKKKGGAP